MTAGRPTTAAGALFGLAALAFVAIAAKTLLHTFAGDSAIYLPYARNIGNADFFSYNPHQFSSGSTSPLWALVLGVPYALGLGVTAAKLVAAALTVTGCALSIEAARRAAGSLLAAALAGFYLVAVLTVTALVLFESSLIVALVAASLLAGQRLVARDDGSPLSARQLAPLALIWAALPLARPEAALLVPLEALALWRLGIRGGRHELKLLVGAMALAAVPAAAYFGYSLTELGVPSTSMQGRAFALRESAERRLGPLYLSSGAIDYLTSGPALWAMLPALPGVALLWRDRERRWLAAYAGGAILLYVLLLTFVTPGFYDTDRYLLPMAPFVVVAAARGLRALETRRMLLPVLAVAAFLLIRPATEMAFDTAPALRDAPYDFDTIVHRDAVAVVNRRAAPGDTVLAYEVQARYFLRDDLKVLSLDGITDGKVAPYAGRGDLTPFLRRYRPRWWILDTSTDPLRGGVQGRHYLVNSVVGAVAARFIDQPRLRSTTAAGIGFTVVARRPGPLPYRFGAWRMIVELRYPPGP